MASLVNGAPVKEGSSPRLSGRGLLMYRGATMKTVQQACLANLLGLPQESATDGGLKPSPLIFFIV